MEKNEIEDEDEYSTKSGAQSKSGDAKKKADHYNADHDTEGKGEQNDEGLKPWEVTRP